MFTFKRKQVDFTKPLGSGSYGTVYPYVTENGDKKKWVVKELTVNQDELKHVVQEIVFGFNHDHPFIVPIVAYHLEEDKNEEAKNEEAKKEEFIKQKSILENSAKEDSIGMSTNEEFIAGQHISQKSVTEESTKKFKIYLRMPRMKNSLGDEISNIRSQSGKILSKENIIRWFYSIASALNYLKNKGIAHRDIKPENVLFDSKGNALIADLGLSKFAGEDVTAYITNIAGTPHYMAPEYGDEKFKENIIDKDLFQADVWSLGMTFIEACSTVRKKVSYPSDVSEVGKFQDKIMVDISDKLDQVKDKYGNELRDILARLLVFNRYERLSYQEICKLLEEEFPEILAKTLTARDLLLKDLHGSDLFEKRDRQIKELASVTRKLNDEWGAHFKIAVGEELSLVPRDTGLQDDILKEFMADTFKTLKSEISTLFRKISIDFSNCREMKPNTLELMRFDWPELENVLNLDLQFVRCDNIFSDDGRLPFKPYLFKSLVNLKILTMNFTGCENITNNSIEGILEIIIKSLGSLEKLSLNLYKCPKLTFKNQEAVKLASYVKKLANLTSFSINLDCDTSDLKQQLSSINNLSFKSN